jgi:hypothetical protein
MIVRFGIRLCAAFAILTTVSCDYGHKQYRPSSDVSSSPSAPLVLEVDDYGRFWDRKAAEAALHTIADDSLNTNTILVVFIHGWHHNADKTDANFDNFQKSLEHLRTKIAQPEYVHAREELHLKEGISVIGLYVGWRGRSLPGWLDYVTFWQRKSAAERVGDGDLREFFIKLQNLYIDRNRPAPTGKPTLMGLVTIGHSFGGQVLFKAISEAFENDLINAVANAEIQPDKVTPKLSEIVSGLGDMTVLLNPAFEAFQYERIDRLTTNTVFTKSQAPVLLTVSAEDDSARKYWFPIGRNLNVLFRPSFQSNEAKKLWTTALGEYEPQQTHILELTDSPATISDALYKDCKIATANFTSQLVVGGAQLKPKDHRDHSHSPVVIAKTSHDLVQEHSGIFGETFSNFLTDYIAFVQGKRMCLIRGMRPITAD